MSETTATTDAPAESAPETAVPTPHATKAPASTPAPEAAALTPIEGLRQRLAESPAPLSLKDATKGLAPKSKKTPPPDFPALLAEEVQAGRAFQYKSGPKEVERFWAKDEKQVIREAVLAAAAQPRKLADLQKTAREATRADKVFANAIVDELASMGQLHKQSNADNALLAREKSRSLDPVYVTTAVFTTVESPQTIANLIKAVAKETGAEKSFVESIVAQLIEEKQLHPQSRAPKPPYGKHAVHALDVEPGKKAFAALVKAGQKLIETVPDVPLSDLFQRLRTALEHQHSAPSSETPPKHEPHHSASPPVSHQPPSAQAAPVDTHPHSHEHSTHDLSLGDTLPSGARH